MLLRYGDGVVGELVVNARRGLVFFFNVTETTGIYTEWIVGSVRCV